MTAPVDVVIVGAGAAGLMTAALLAARSPSHTVVLLDGARKPGAKILVSGGGRCNVTNVAVSERDFWGGSRASIRQVLRAFSVDDTRAFFSRLGVTLHEESDGKLFPDSNRARDVLDALLAEVHRAGAMFRADYRVSDVRRDLSGRSGGDVDVDGLSDGGFVITTNHGPLRARVVVLATGGRALPKSGSDGAGYDLARHLGHTIVDTTPALAPLLLDASRQRLHTTLSGVAHQAELSVWVDGRVTERLTGALLWTHFGISGPVVLNVSRLWARASIEGRPVAITMNVVPGMTFEALDHAIVAMIHDRPRASLATLLAHSLPASVATALVAGSGFDPTTEGSALSREARRRFSQALTAWPLAITDTRGYTHAEATAGGVSLAEVSPRTLESRVCPGLYLVGEVLDVDGRLGGFNFQWAWSSAFVAARAIAARVRTGADGME